MKRAKLLSVFAAGSCLALAVSTAAFAEDKGTERNHRGVYGGAGLGPAWHEGSGSAELAWRFMAWIRPVKYLSLEFGYFNLRENDLGEKTDGFALSGVPTLPIGPFDLYGKAGFAVSFVNNNTELEPTFGGGAAYQWKRLGARLEYERFQLEQTANVGWFILYYQLGDF